MSIRIFKAVAIGSLATAISYLGAAHGSEHIISWHNFINDWQLISGLLLVFTILIFWAIGNEETVDIDSQGEYPAYPLSNLYQCPFYFDGVYCASREGLLQAFKTEFINEQVRLCGLPGSIAQKAGQQYNNWKDDQFLYWHGKSYKRDSQEYWDLLLRVFDPENMSVDVLAALLATHNRELVHSIGKSDITDTVLTELEFCSLMTIARTKLKEKGLAYIG